MKANNLKLIKLRKYSIAELNEMRSLIAGTLRTGVNPAVPSYIEDQLQTYMINGTTIEELRYAAGLKNIEWLEKRIYETRGMIILAEQTGKPATNGHGTAVFNMIDGLMKIRLLIIKIEQQRAKLGI